MDISHRGGSGVSLEGGCGVEGGGHDKICPKRGKIFLTSGLRRWYIFGAYVPLNDAPDVHSIENSLEAAPKGMEVILLGAQKKAEGTMRRQGG